MNEHPGQLSVIWSDRLEELADCFYSLPALSGPLARECVVVAGRVMAGWLRHHFVYDYARGEDVDRRVLANTDFQPLFVFVNDWLHRMDGAAEDGRDPRFHPYSVESMQWRIYDRLYHGRLQGADYAELTDYLGDAPDPRRIFTLSGRLAQLLDDYVVYRPDMLYRWGQGTVDDGVPAWQPALWRSLVDEDPATYLQQFLELDRGGLDQCGIDRHYERVTVFAPPTMPPVYLHFFSRLAGILPVRLLLFNPCLDHWQGDLTPREAEKLRSHDLGLAAVDEDELYLDVHNPLLTSFGVLTREFTGEALNRDDIVLASTAEPQDNQTQPPAGVLQALQQAVRTRQEPETIDTSDDDSIRIHLCHSAAREVDVLCDQLYHWFSTMPHLRPRDIQVQVTDLATYVPYIDAALSRFDRYAGETIPYAVADRAQMRTSQVAAAFVQLLQLPESRFKADEIIDLLECEAVHSAFDLDSDQVAALRDCIGQTGIAWGRDAAHRDAEIGLGYAETSWQQGLDRMLLGYALGDEAGQIDRMTLCCAGELGELQPFTEIEDNAGTLGKFLRFYDQLVQWSDTLTTEHAAEDWGAVLTELIDTFFESSATTYRDVAALRRAAQSLSRLTTDRGVSGPLPLAVVRTFLEDEIERADAGDALVADAVVVSGLRAGSSTPRRVVCLLGMNDDLFPRPDNRPAYDLLRTSHRPCDPSIRLADRNAFLEAIMSARERLMISYVARSERGNEELPPSPLVAELTDYLQQHGLATHDPALGLLDCEVLHRLQAFHPAYFSQDHADDPDNRLSSFSTANHAAAAALVGAAADEAGTVDEQAAPAADAGTREQMDVSEWCEFFVNPAKAYFRDRLQARFDYADRTVLADSEHFELGGLDKYTVSQEVMDACLEGKDMTPCLQPMQQQGRLPLGDPGAETLAEYAADISERLDKPIKREHLPSGVTARKLLGLPSASRRVHVQLKQIEIIGELDVCDCDGTILSLSCRYTKVKAKDRLRAWLRHLLLCVEGPEVCTVHMGAECGVNRRDLRFDNEDPVVIPPLPSDQAREILLRDEALLCRGREEILPFAPATSLAAAQGRGQEGNKWHSDFNHAEGDDAYLSHAFGLEGPMTHADFRDVATAIYRPCLVHLGYVQPEPGGDQCPSR